MFNLTRYNQISNIFYEYPNLLPRIIESSDGSVYKLKTNIHNVYDVRLKVCELKKAMRSPADLADLIADAYAKKAKHKIELTEKQI